MHEAAIAQSVVKTVLEEAEKQNAQRVDSVEIEVGELSFIGVDQVSFWVKTSFEGTVAENAKLIFNTVKARIRCKECEFEGDLRVEEDPAFHMRLPQFSCPKCQSSKIEITQGRDAFIRRIQIVKE